jgi:hemolysin-activating ACP:hemolysin acyltransferase
MDKTKYMNVSVHGAKTQLSKLLDLVEDGESIVIERHGRPVAWCQWASAAPPLSGHARTVHDDRRLGTGAHR